MLKAVEFEVSSEFANFRRPDMQELALTFNFIPKSAVLGICGAILGLGGYKKGEKPEFIEKLKHLKVGVLPINETAPGKPFRKAIVSFNNFHGYGNYDGNGLYKDQILIRPKYRITIIEDQNSEQLNKLETNLSKNQTSFRPYLGKNEFLANISFVGSGRAETCNTDKIHCQSIYAVNRSFTSPERSRILLTQTNNLILEDYPYSMDEQFNHKRHTFCIEDGEILPEKADLTIGKFYKIGSENKTIFAF
jgi:CRISPR-associated protein Cas5 subtype I-B